jgi:hypothetical protein
LSSDGARKALSKDALSRRAPDLWRYCELLPRAISSAWAKPLRLAEARPEARRGEIIVNY